MATNKYPWSKNLHGAQDPLIWPMKAAAGSTRTFKAGEILTYDENSGVVTAVNAVADSQYSLVVAAEEQKSTDPARYVNCFMLRDGDVFEFTLSTSAAVAYGSSLSLVASQSQQLTVDVDGDGVAKSVTLDNIPQVGTTLTTKSYVECVFNRSSSFYYQNVIGNDTKKIIEVAGARTITASDNGKVFVSTAAAQLTAPTSTVPVGFYIDIMVGHASIVSFDPKPDTASVVIAGAVQTAGLYFSMTDEGDFARCMWDGTNWLVTSGIGGAEADITIES